MKNCNNAAAEKTKMTPAIIGAPRRAWKARYGHLLEGARRYKPRQREEAAEQGRQKFKEIAAALIKVLQRKVGRKQAEIHTHREYQLNQARARFTHFHHGGPQDVSQDETDKVEILGKLHYEMCHQLGTGLLNHGVGKQCRAGK